MIRFTAMILIGILSFSQLMAMSKTIKDFPDYEAMWKKVEEFERQGQPKSALKEVELIYDRATSEDNEAQKVKTFIYRLKLSSQLDEDGAASALTKSENILTNSKAPAKYFYYSILAEKYAIYQQAYQYQIQNRHHDLSEGDDDIRVWSNQQFKERISDYFQKSLDDGNLKDASLEQYKAIIQGESYDKDVRPTMYDILLHRVFDYVQHTNEKWNVALKNEQTNLTDFLRDRTDDRLKELEKNDQITAFIDLKLRLLQREKSNDGTEYRNQLFSLQKKFSNHPSSVQLAYLRLESLFYSPQSDTLNLPDLKNELEEKIREFPKSRGAEMAKAFIANTLMVKNLSFTHEAVVGVNEYSKFLVEYQNIPSIYIHLAKVEAGTEIKRMNTDGRGRPNWSEFEFDDPMLVQLPAKKDLRRHTTEIKLDPLPTGEYLLVITTNKKIKNDEPGGFSFFYSSRMAALWSQPYLYAIDRQSGKPLEGVQVTCFQQDYDHQLRRQTLRELNTDSSNKEGQTAFSPENHHNVFFRLKKENDEVYFNRSVYIGSRGLRDESQARNMVQIYTDRAIYRPGQVIQFKVLAHQYSNHSKDWIRGQNLEFELRDANHQVIEKVKGVTNEFGAFSSSFQIPKEVLPGRFTIGSVGSVYGNQQIRVEEYKRPQIKAEFLPSTDEFTLGDSIQSQLEVATYFGSLIKDARVEYRVSRVWFTPYFYSSNFYRGCHFPWREVEEEIKVGEAVTNEEGKVTIGFQTEEFDPASRFSPWARYKVTATVISQTGESLTTEKRYELSNAPYKVMGPTELTLSLKEEKNLSIQALNFDGENVKKSVNYSWVKLVPPSEAPFKKRFWQAPDAPLYDSVEFKKWFPQEMYQEEGHIYQWKTMQVDSGVIDIDGSTTVKSINKLNEPGIYQLRIFSGNGEKLYTSAIYLYDAEEKTLPLGFDQFLIHHDPLETGKNNIHILSPPGYEQFMVIDHLQVHSWNPHPHSIHLHENYRNRAFVQVVGIHQDRSTTRVFSLPYSKDQFLSIQVEKGWEEKVEPGQNIRWVIQVKDKDDKPVETELFLTVFDASLNAYSPHQWNTSTLQWPRGYQRDLQIFGIASDRGNGLGYYHKRQSYDDVHYPQLINFGMRWPHDGRVLMRNKDYGSAPMTMEADVQNLESVTVREEAEDGTQDQSKANPPQPRENLTEAAYFATALQTDQNGKANIEFEMSESLGEWETFIMAVDQDFKYQLVEKKFTTSKPLLIQPFTPRFGRSGDEMQLNARLSNVEASDVRVTTSLELEDAITGQSLNSWLTSGLGHTFLLPNNQTESVDWKIQVPQDFIGIIKYTMSVKGGIMADAEVGYFPILTHRKLVTESASIFLKPGEEVQTELNKYDLHFASDQTRVRSRLELVSQPLWYVFQALPYLGQVENESITQWVNTLFVHQVGLYSLDKYPWLGQVIKAQNDTSKLALNQDLKNIVTQLTPYQQDALLELDQHEKFNQYFDREQIELEIRNLLSQIKKRQLASGGYSWMPGGRDSWYMSQYVLLKLIQIQKITGINLFEEAWVQNLHQYCHQRLKEYYQKYWSDNNKHRGISYIALQSLYIDAMLQDFEDWGEAKNTLWKRSLENWVDQPLINQSMITYILFQKGDDQEKLRMMKKSFDERLIDGKDRGMFWKYSQGSRISEQDVLIHSHMMEVYHLLEDDEKLSGLLTWLIQNKRTQMWKNQMASVYAIQAILQTTDRDHEVMQPIWVKLDGKEYADENNSLAASRIFEVQTNLQSHSTLSIKNHNEHVGWVNLYRQFEQDFDQIQSHGSESLTVERTYWIKDQNSKVIPLESSTSLQKGDVILVKLRISSDRDMEYMALEDHRPGAFEPGVALSGYVWEGGLSYYQATRDRVTQFFIDYLPRGEHLIEYELTAAHSGTFTGGLAELQSLYAPEFRTFSQGVEVKVKD